MLKNLTIANFKTDPDKKGNVTMVPWVDSADKIPGAKYNFKNKRYGMNPKLVLAILDEVSSNGGQIRAACQQAIDQAEAFNNPQQLRDPETAYPIALDGNIIGNMTLTEAAKACGPDHYIYIDNNWKPAMGVLGLKPTLPPPPAPKKVQAELVDEDVTESVLQRIKG
jgi:hypothetical protein